MESFNKTENPDFMDPITYSFMRDPVIISSGIVLDSSTVIKENGNFNLKICPFTREELVQKVYPVSFLKSKIID